MQNKIYQYFSETHGQVKDKDIYEYQNQTKNQLKNHLKLLKQPSTTDFDHQTEFYKNYWKYC